MQWSLFAHRIMIQNSCQPAMPAMMVPETYGGGYGPKDGMSYDDQNMYRKWDYNSFDINYILVQQNYKTNLQN